MEDFDEILVPGEPEARNAAAQSRKGISIPEPVIRDLIQLAEELNVKIPKTFRRPVV